MELLSLSSSVYFLDLTLMLPQGFLHKDSHWSCQHPDFHIATLSLLISSNLSHSPFSNTHLPPSLCWYLFCLNIHCCNNWKVITPNARIFQYLPVTFTSQSIRNQCQVQYRFPSYMSIYPGASPIIQTYQLGLVLTSSKCLPPQSELWGLRSPQPYYSASV